MTSCDCPLCVRYIYDWKRGTVIKRRYPEDFMPKEGK